MHYIRICKTVKEIVAAIESSNRYLAKCRDLHPDKFVAMATCVPGGGDEVLKELERAVKQDDARAVIINSSHQGHYPDEDAAKPFFKLVTDLDIPVFVHPGDATTPAMADYRLASSIGRPADNCLSLARLIVRGIFEQFPTLKLVGSHLGGGICEVIGRMDYAYELPDFSRLPRPLRADADQASAEPLPEDDVFQFRLLLRRPRRRCASRPSATITFCSAPTRRR